jgi:hypothetical protein
LAVLLCDVGVVLAQARYFLHCDLRIGGRSGCRRQLRLPRKVLPTDVREILLRVAIRVHMVKKMLIFSLPMEDSNVLYIKHNQDDSP